MPDASDPAEALGAREPEGACVAPAGNLCTDTGCWDAGRCVVRPAPAECPSGCGRNEPCPDRWHDDQRSEGGGWAAYAAEQERHAETTARLDLMTREARLSRESTERAVRRLERLRQGVAYLHDVYAVSPNEPRCCSDCAALDISNELRRLLADTREPFHCYHCAHVGDHAACAGIAWEPDVPCECPHA